MTQNNSLEDKIKWLEYFFSNYPLKEPIDFSKKEAAEIDCIYTQYKTHSLYIKDWADPVQSLEDKIKAEGNYVAEILHGYAPLTPPDKTYRDVVYSLRSAMIQSIKLPQGSALSAQLIDVANLLWDYEQQRLKAIEREKELEACLSNLNQAIDNYWNSPGKSDSLIKLINKHQQIAQKIMNQIK